jgi:hypothetical protein
MYRHIYMNKKVDALSLYFTASDEYKKEEIKIISLLNK